MKNYLRGSYMEKRLGNTAINGQTDRYKPFTLSRREFVYRITTVRSRSSSVSIVSDYELDDQGLIPDNSRGFFF
jgi:hypothetical protein